ncbi:hypothetical protein KS4_12150 [Poriferisphaera corsica]|uniref:Uncharacterized protein n=1 Tax=Poriferisphaera corsica TaxID=2528020 RepID=A0A517YSG8_9BACT|nr:hypothetical protein [Poriferisphaera corsica]QDU33170.1 hypothetical protein KS4_12150 [Poriferisphaera corsica]
MIRSIRFIVVALLLAHMVLLLAGMGWLAASGRLNRERFDNAVEIFKLTIEDQANQEETQFAEAQKADEQLQEALRLQSASNGSQSFDQYLGRSQASAEVAMEQYARLTREIKDLERRIQVDKQIIEQQKKKLKEDRDTLEQDRIRYANGNSDEDFQRTVTMFTKIPSKQAKQIMQQMLMEDKLNDIVDYLNAMGSTKSAGVLREFKSPAEIDQAKQIIERIRTRGQLAQGQ